MLAAGLTCFACQLCAYVQFCFECHSWLLNAFAPSPPSLSLAMVSIWGGKYAPGGCCSQGCRGYLHALLEAHISATASLKAPSQAQLLAMSLMIVSIIKLSVRIADL